ncbi:MAG: hypothetical protein PHW04_08545 [Candidatus Wallbacteria bacterium]|nr:hypothetical protein [Candidatus Wallbacteria bacterium]
MKKGIIICSMLALLCSTAVWSAGVTTGSTANGTQFNWYEPGQTFIEKADSNREIQSLWISWTDAGGTAQAGIYFDNQLYKTMEVGDNQMFTIQVNKKISQIKIAVAADAAQINCCLIRYKSEPVFNGPNGPHYPGGYYDQYGVFHPYYPYNPNYPNYHPSSSYYESGYYSQDGVYHYYTNYGYYDQHGYYHQHNGPVEEDWLSGV